MKSAPLLIAICAANLIAVGAAAQLPGPDGITPTEASRDQREIRYNEKDLVKKMHLTNLSEIKLGQLAINQAEQADVKAYAQMMVADHQKSDEELQSVARQLGETLPTQLDDTHQKLADRLAGLRGAAFDREYMQAMVKGHKDALQDAQAMRAAPTTVGTSGSVAPGAVRGDTDDQDKRDTVKNTPTTTVGTAPSVEFALKTVPTIQQHLDRAEAIERSLANK